MTQAKQVNFNNYSVLSSDDYTDGHANWNDNVLDILDDSDKFLKSH